MFPAHTQPALNASLLEHCKFLSISTAHLKSIIIGVEQNRLSFNFALVFVQLADINECSMPNKCQNGECVNTEGSYTCECNSGYSKSWRGLCEGESHASAQMYALRFKFTQRHNCSVVYSFIPWQRVVCHSVCVYLPAFLSKLSFSLTKMHNVWVT